MGIKPLLDLTCLKVTFQLTGKNAEEVSVELACKAVYLRVTHLLASQIRQILNLPELTPEEEAKAREEHKWIFEDN